MSGGPLSRLLIRASRSDALRRWARESSLVRPAVRRFVPGEEASDALEAGRHLSEEGIQSVLTFLGENVSTEAEAEGVRDHYLEVLERSRGHPGEPEISVKLTHLGLELGPEIALESTAVLAEASAGTGRTLWLDMESAPYVDPTLEIFRRLRQRGADAGVCLQAYLYRTEEDLEELLEIGGGLRLVKGAYDEPDEIAFQEKRRVDENFLRLARRILDAAGEDLRPAFATHDRRLLRTIRDEARGRGLEPGDYEFQMMYGIRTDVQRELARQGEAVRVLVSYGSHWFPWYMRRLAERPANLLFVLREALPG